jgi:hypothetical protein
MTFDDVVVFVWFSVICFSAPFFMHWLVTGRRG